ncbi:hypothetical protein LX64_00324 [Chitinophaga skermanii]|uniref:TolB-like protein n=1 Tax=Chitinophaga skermanii TaxID=331697 RepID=A0A327R3U0_9BACT|nr:hypothetical protein [Chitinophaga skermanii]RAJ10718.1 hypothetical protein LX64_00324 [Chitinophaga skermanii]
MKQKVITIILLGSTCSLLLAIMLHFSNLPNKKNNGFIRIFSKNELKIQSTEIITNDINRICGVSKSQYYFAGTDPRIILSCNDSLKKWSYLSVARTISPTFYATNSITIDSPYIYLYSNNEKIILINKIGNSTDSINIQSTIFTKSLPLDSNHSIVRAFDPTYQKQTFQLINNKTGIVEKENEIINQNNDGGFLSDGNLIFDKQSKSFFYITSYFNKVYKFNENLEILNKFNTIDTVEGKDLGLSIVNKSNSNEQKIAPSKARIEVNKHASYSNNLLYVYSGLRADNESLSIFNSRNIIDIYEANTGKYLNSIVIPNYKNERLKQFLVNENKLIALYKNAIIVFTM